jgi:ribonuclease-3
MSGELDNLEAALGHRFHNREILVRALTHSSRVRDGQGPAPVYPHADNEQMEFLGDSVLGFLVSETLVLRFPSYSEGRLTKLKAHLVSAVYLHDVARKLELGQYLFLGRGEEMTGGRTKRKLLVDCLEALIAGVYLDGGIDAARMLVNRHVIGDVTGEAQTLETEILGGPIVDFKTALSELATARKLPPPRYVTVEERGPGHLKTFTIEVRVGKEWTGQAEGMSKKSAAQNAARGLFARLVEECPAP